METLDRSLGWEDPEEVEQLLHSYSGLKNSTDRVRLAGDGSMAAKFDTTDSHFFTSQKRTQITGFGCLIIADTQNCPLFLVWISVLLRNFLKFHTEPGRLLSETRQ